MGTAMNEASVLETLWSAAGGPVRTFALRVRGVVRRGLTLRQCDRVFEARVGRLDGAGLYRALDLDDWSWHYRRGCRWAAEAIARPQWDAFAEWGAVFDACEREGRSIHEAMRALLREIEEA